MTYDFSRSLLRPRISGAGGMTKSHRCKMLMEIRYGFNAFVKIKDVILLIRAVQVITVQSKTHEHDLYTQLFFKQRTDGNTATTTYRDRVFAKRIFNGGCGCPVAFTVNGSGYPALRCTSVSLRCRCNPAALQLLFFNSSFLFSHHVAIRY